MKKSSKLLTSLVGLAFAIAAFATTCPWPVDGYYSGGDGCQGFGLGFCTEPTVTQGGCLGSGAPISCNSSTVPVPVPHYGTADGSFSCNNSPGSTSYCTQMSTTSTLITSGTNGGSSCVDSNNCSEPPPHVDPSWTKIPYCVTHL